MKPRFLLLALVAALGFATAPLLMAEGEPTVNPTLVNCSVLIKDRVNVPAREAGALVDFQVEQGMVVTKGQKLGSIDDGQAKLQKLLAEAEMKLAIEQANSPYDIKYADAASEVAKKDFEIADTANRERSGTFSLLEVQYKRLNWEKLRLQSEKARFDQELMKMQATAKQYEVEMAEILMQRREIVAPIDGEVTIVGRREGEWVNPGDPVVEIVNHSVLYVKGWLPQAIYNLGDIEGKPVTVEVLRENGRRVRIRGVVLQVDPNLQLDGTYYVLAKVENKWVGDQWELLPGLDAEMTIHIH